MLPRKQKHAFSLVELLLVVVVLGVIAAMALPNFSQSFSQLQLEETARNIAYLLRVGQSQAIIKEKKYRLSFAPDYRTYRLTRVAVNGTGSGSADTQPESATPESFEDVGGRNGRIFHVPDDVYIECSGNVVNLSEDGDMEPVRIYLRNQKGQYATVSTQEQLGHVLVFEFKLE